MFNSSLTQEAFVDSVDQDQTAQNVQSDLWSTLSTLFTLDYNLTVSSSYRRRVVLAYEKVRYIYLIVKELKV